MHCYSPKPEREPHISEAKISFLFEYVGPDSWLEV